ncbi:hypothetical protein LEMLEM_LOCUS8985, partial [Lemmus lemmus]
PHFLSLGSQKISSNPPPQSSWYLHPQSLQAVTGSQQSLTEKQVDQLSRSRCRSSGSSSSTMSAYMPPCHSMMIMEFKRA